MDEVPSLLKAQICIPSHRPRMATYVYETIPQRPDESPFQFEVVQSMKAPPLAKHPDTGQPVRRVVMGGYGLISARGKSPSTSAQVAACSLGCACHRGPRIPSL
jgi:predicted nucleic acid-binding Zn ribbon protein